MSDVSSVLDSRTRHFGFLTLPSYSMIAFTSALEVLRVANYEDRTERYRWTVFSVDGTPVEASNGIAIRPTQLLDLSGQLPDVMIVCGGTRIREAVDARTRMALAALAQRKVVLGALCSGAYALMTSGPLDNYRCAVHWEDLYMLRAEFPNVQIASELFVVDRDRMTCTGGTTPLDMMLNLLSKHLGQQLVTRVSQHLILARLRRGTEDQPMPVGARVGFLRTELVEAVKLMEANIEDPLSFAELARLIEMSERQMQRIFKRDLNMSPRQYYRTVRLKYAGGLLRTSNESIEHVSSRCGFNSLCRFSKAYRREFGHAPIIERRIQK